MVFFYLLIERLSSLSGFDKVFTKMVHASVDDALDVSTTRRINWSRVKLITLWAVVHVTHWGMYIGNLLAVVMLVVYAQWYVALPIITIISTPHIGGIHCLYNNLENHYRELLGWPLIEANFLPTALAELNQFIRKFKK